jgi:WD40 repeat protein
MLGALLVVPVLSLLPQQVPEWIDLFLSGSRALEEGSLDIAASDLESALRILPEHGATAWQLACVYACAGQSNEAFEWLERAVEWGGGEVALLDWDPDLASLLERPQTREIRERLRLREEKSHAQPPDARFVCAGWNSFQTSSSDGSIVGVDVDCGTLLYDRRARETLAVLGLPRDAHSRCSMTPDGHWVVQCGEMEDGGNKRPFLRLFDARTGDFVREIEADGHIGAPRFSSDGERMFDLSDGGIWSTRSWERVGTLPAGETQRVLSPDGKRLFSYSAREQPDGTPRFVGDVFLWDTEQHRHLLELRDLDFTHFLTPRFSSDGSLSLVVDEGGRLRILDSERGETVRTIQAEQGLFRNACFLSTAGLATLRQDLLLQLWDLQKDKPTAEIQLTGEALVELEPAPDGEILLVCSDSGQRLDAYDARTGAIAWSLREPLAQRIWEVRFTRDSSRILMDSEHWTLTIHDPKSGGVLDRIEGPGFSSVIPPRLPRDSIWVGASDGSLRRINAMDGRTRATSRIGKEAITSFCFDRAGKRLAAMDRSGTLRILDPTTGVMLAESSGLRGSDFEYGDHLEFSPDGSMLGIGGPRSPLQFYSAPDWKLAFTIDAAGESACWSWRADSQQIAVGGRDGIITLFDAKSGEPMSQGLTVDGGGSMLVFELAGTRLWVNAGHSFVSVFDMENGSLVQSMPLAQVGHPYDEVWLGSIAFRGDNAVAVTGTGGWGVVEAWVPATGERLWTHDYEGGNGGTLSCSFGQSGNTVYVWGQGWWTPRLIDSTTGKTTLDLADREIDELVPLADERLVGALGSGGLEVIDVHTGKRRWARIETSNDGWLLHSPSLYFDGTREALEEVQLMLPERSYPLDALAAALLDPKKMRAAADGVVIAPAVIPPIPTLAWTGEVPRVLQLDSSSPAPTVTLEASCSDGLTGFEVVRNGERTRLQGERLDATHARLVLTIERPAGDSEQLRFRAISSRGILSRALHLTVEPSQ